MQAEARLRQAQAEAQAQFGYALPSVDGTVSAVRQQINPEAFGFNTPKPGPFTLYSASLSVSYALDILAACAGRWKHRKRRPIHSVMSWRRRGCPWRAMW